jgi:hypothetical protein
MQNIRYVCFMSHKIRIYQQTLVKLTSKKYDENPLSQQVHFYSSSLQMCPQNIKEMIRESNRDSVETTVIVCRTLLNLRDSKSILNYGPDGFLTPVPICLITK